MSQEFCQMKTGFPSPQDVRAAFAREFRIVVPEPPPIDVARLKNREYQRQHRARKKALTGPGKNCN